MKTIHVAEMIAHGGRDGSVETPEGGFAVQLSTDEKPGSITPEHLFAGAYAACFLGAVENAIRQAHESTDGLTVVSRVHLEEDTSGGYQLQVDLRAALPGIDEAKAQHLLQLAHQSCPYSKATRGNVNVILGVD